MVIFFGRFSLVIDLKIDREKMIKQVMKDSSIWGQRVEIFFWKFWPQVSLSLLLSYYV